MDCTVGMVRPDPPSSSGSGSGSTWCFRSALTAYRDGIVGVEAVAALARSYRGPCGHLLWDRDESNSSTGRFKRHFHDCLYGLSGPKLEELIRALIDVDPNFPSILSPPDVEPSRRGRMSFLGAALDELQTRGGRERVPAATAQVLILLTTPTITRHRGRDLTRRNWPPPPGPPLHQACRIRDIDLAVVDRLIDVDPDVLMMEDDGHQLPLECVLYHQLRRGRFVRVIARMMKLRPESLGRVTRGPRIFYLWKYPPAPQQPVIMTLFDHAWDVPEDVLILAFSMAPPECVRRGTSRRYSTALPQAIEFCPNQDLVSALIDAFPQALCLACALDIDGRPKMPLDRAPPLPHEQASELTGARTRSLVPVLRAEFMHVALAVVEHLHHASTAAFEEGPSGAAAFQRRVQDMVATAFAPADDTSSHPPPPPPSMPCAIKVVQAIRALPSEQRLDLLASLFRRREDAIGLSRDDVLRQAVMGDAVTGLYRLNRQFGGTRTDPSPPHQVRVLAAASDTGNLDCIYVQLRHHGLPLVRHASESTRTARRRRRALTALSSTRASASATETRGSDTLGGGKNCQETPSRNSIASSESRLLEPGDLCTCCHNYVIVNRTGFQLLL